MAEMNPEPIYEYFDNKKEVEGVELLFPTNNRSLTIGLPSFIKRIRDFNAFIANPEDRQNENILAISQIPETQQLIELIKQIPPAILEPYLSPIEPDN